MKPMRTLALLLAALLLAGCNLPANQSPAAGTPTPGVSAAATLAAAVTQRATIPAQPAPGQEVLVLTRADTNARTGPGMDYPVAYLLPAGLIARALGRSADNRWLVVTNPASELDQPALWVAAEVVDMRGDLNLLAVVAGPALPTPTTTVTRTPAP